MEKKNILLVDDDKDLVEAMAALLATRNFTTFSAHNRKDGLKLAKEKKPNLIILDVQMETPFSGFEFQVERSADAELKNIPVLMNTGIEVMSTNDSVVEMIREMRKNPDFKDRTVLLVRSYDGTAAVDYLTETGAHQFFYVDGFLSKPVEPDQFFEEIDRILNKK